MKLIAGIIASILACLLISVAIELPRFGDPHSPANEYVASYYLENAYKDGHVPNVITSVLADYRSFDTMFETCVVFIAGVGIMAILFGTSKKSKHAVQIKSLPSNNSVIIQTATRFIVPMMQLFAFYVVAHGHYSPGGGFQGGVVLAASLILLALAFQLKGGLAFMSKKAMIGYATAGVLLYAGIGVVCMLYKADFLDYSALAYVLPSTDKVMARSHGMLGVEIGVTLTVMSILFGIYTQLASNGHMDEGL
ncbi:MAG: hydrogen gas-evolving membrane-bound hydrogenase subunit E [bacterium]